MRGLLFTILVILLLAFVWNAGAGLINGLLITPQMTIQEEAKAISAQAEAIKEQSKTIGTQSNDIVLLSQELVKSARAETLAYQMSLFTIVGVVIFVMVLLFIVANKRGRMEDQHFVSAPPRYMYQQLPRYERRPQLPSGQPQYYYDQQEYEDNEVYYHQGYR